MKNTFSILCFWLSFVSIAFAEDAFPVREDVTFYVSSDYDKYGDRLLFVTIKSVDYQRPGFSFPIPMLIQEGKFINTDKIQYPMPVEGNVLYYTCSFNMSKADIRKPIWFHAYFNKPMFQITQEYLDKVSKKVEIGNGVIN